jgi:hypothetical protein
MSLLKSKQFDTKMANHELQQVHPLYQYLQVKLPRYNYSFSNGAKE